eukprot:11189837-Alexandrium_andersonii.AAC.1
MGRRLMGRAGGVDHRAGTSLPCALMLFPLVREGKKRRSRRASHVIDFRNLPLPNGARLNASVDVIRRSSLG